MKLSFLEDPVRNALSGMASGPLPLLAAIKFYSQEGRTDAGKVVADLLKSLRAGPNNEVRKLLNGQLKQWDWEASAPWSAGTQANTRERRQRIYDLMRIQPELRRAFDEYVPPYEGARSVLVEDPKNVEDWYTFEFRKTHDFYWKRLRAFLERTGKIPSDSINSLDDATNNILGHFGDPSAEIPHRARGLVVGYVQSGKTTNFTGVIAKAVDAGYRLIIVLSGTTNLLRNQTQRRLDMELVGVENILRGAKDEEAEHDYKDDEAWPHKFISYGKQPSLLGHIDMLRLTGQQDFQSQDVGLNPLEFEFEKRNKQRPLYDRENLDHAGARIVVVKKQRDRLRRLIRDLKSVGEAKCAEVPALVIDDESDQASVNTQNPEKVVDKTRSRINECIVDLLKRLPRAQYLGYTATPFANVFVDPKDPADIYPKDFILSLERPKGYIGAREFHDFDEPNPGRMTNEAAFIRGIPNPEKAADDRLVEAIDAFVLTGALKKYRESHGGAEFRHHTMLVHHSHSQAEHAAAVDEIRALWKQAGYDSLGPGSNRMRVLLEEFRGVWQDRGKSVGLSFPKDFIELKPALGAALDEIRRGDPVLMVNSAEGNEVPDFDRKQGVWKIIVGGAKLSRGYTIEGLTISYFRRRAKMQDTLMQMGRWFGYRPGYQDLVRLYIGRNEPDGKRNTLDLFKAFEAICRDEEDFRAQLAMYGGKNGITPELVPALVFNSYPQLRPTARNRMFNSELVWAGFDYREPTTQSVSNDGRAHNAKLFERLIRSLDIENSQVKVLKSKGVGFTIMSGAASHQEVLSVLDKLQWEKAKSPINAEIEYLRRKELPIDSWILLAPQVPDSQGGKWNVGRLEFRCVFRSRPASATRFGVFSSPEHVSFAKWLVGANDTEFLSPRLRRSERTGILLFYPTREVKVSQEEEPSVPVPVMGFGILLPKNGLRGQRFAYRVKPRGTLTQK